MIVDYGMGNLGSILNMLKKIGTRAVISSDPDAIRQALFNLLDNAVKYSGDGREVRLRIERQADWAVVTVRDWGIGISKPQQQKIFERFHRVGTGLVHDVKGSGLGLSIVRHVVEAHGGEIVVESEPGAGSTFTIRLPLPAEAAPCEAIDHPAPRLRET